MHHLLTLHALLASLHADFGGGPLVQVGHAREPQEQLLPGQTVTVEIDGIGALVNRVVAEQAAPAGSGA